MERLNGWQRLWVVTSLLIGIVIAVIIATHLPNEQDEAERHGYAIRNLNEQLARVIENKKNVNMRDVDIANGKTVENINLRIALENYEYSTSAETLTSRQFQNIGWGLAFWLGISGALYVIGYAVKWVYRGFRPN
jgi:hypothetical protein